VPVALVATILALESDSYHYAVAVVFSCTLGCWDGFRYYFQQMINPWPNNSPEPPPIAFLVPLSRLTRWAARLSFCR
jgi:hypothetical protein